MALLLLFFALLSIAEACAPGGEPAYVALFTEETYTPQREPFYKDHAETLLKRALEKYGIPYDPSYFTIGARSSFNKVAIDVFISTGADCKSLPDFVKELMKGNFLVTGAGMRCGSDPKVTYVYNDARRASPISDKENM
ncbi:hypothetical protein Aduo_007751 [Ancylostoma duodenale]